MINILLHIIKFNHLKFYQMAQSNYHIIIEPILDYMVKMRDTAEFVEILMV